MSRANRRNGNRLCVLIAFLLIFGFCSDLKAQTPFVLETVDESVGFVGSYASLTADTLKAPHISYRDASARNLLYATKVGGSWIVETAHLSTNNVGLHTSIAIDTANQPNISFYDRTLGHLKYTWKSNAVWTTDEITIPGLDIGLYSSIAVDAGGDVHISYYSSTEAALRYSRKSGGVWSHEIADSSFGDVGRYSSLAVAADGDLHVGYYDAGTADLKYAIKSGAVWTAETVESTANQDGLHCSLVLDNGSNPHIAYYDATAGNLKYATKSAAIWTIEIVDGSADDRGEYASIVLDGAGDPAISYYDRTNDDLKFATKSSGTWRIQTIHSSVNDVGRYSSLAIDDGGDLHVAYLDDTEGNLLYAFASPDTGVVTHSGFDHASLGNAIIDTAANRLIVTNIGSSGEDGVRIEIGARDAWTAAIGMPDAAALPIGARLEARYCGSINGGPPSFLMASSREIAVNHYRFAVSFSDSILANTGDALYEVLRNGDVVARTKAPEGAVRIAPLGSADKNVRMFGPGDPLNGIDVSLIDKTTDSPIMVTDLPGDHEVTLPGMPTVIGDRIRVSVTNLVQAVSSFCNVTYTGRDIDSLNLGAELAASSQTLPVFGLSHVSRGFVGIDSSGGQLTISNIGSSGEDGITVDLGTNTAWTADFAMPDASAMPIGARMTTFLYGPIGAGPAMCVATAESRKETDHFTYRVTFSDSILGPSGKILYETLNNGDVVARTVAAPEAVRISEPGSKWSTNSLRGPGDPLNGIDVSLIDKTTESPIMIRSLPQDYLITLPGLPATVGDRVRLRPATPVAPVSHFTKVTLGGVDVDTIAMGAEEVATSREIRMGGRTHTSRAFADVEEVGSLLIISNIGSSGEDGISIDLARSTAWMIDHATPPAESLAVGARLTSRYFGSIDGGPETVVLESRLEKASGHYRYFLLPNVSLLEGGSDLEYEVLASGRVVARTNAPLDTVRITDPFPLSKLRGPGDPLNGIDVSLIDKTTESPIMLGKKWGENYDIELPGLAPVSGDQIRILIPEPAGELADFSNVLIVGTGLDSLVLSGEAAATSRAMRFGGIEHVSRGFAFIDASGDELVVSNIGSSGEDGVTMDLAGASSWEVRVGTPSIDSLAVGAFTERTLRGVSSAALDTLILLRQRFEVTKRAGQNKLGIFLEVEPAVQDPSGTIHYEVFADTLLMDSLTAAADTVIVGTPGAPPFMSKGPGDPLNGIDVSLIDKTTTSPIAVKRIWDQDVEIELPGQSAVQGNQLTMTVAAPAIRVESFTSAQIRGAELGFFNLSQPSTAPTRLALHQPTGGETWFVGAMATIDWMGAQSVDIALSLDGGLTYMTLRSGYAPPPLAIRVPHAPTRFAMVRVTDSNAQGVVAVSDSFFVIDAVITLNKFLAEPADQGVRLSWETSPGPESDVRYRIERETEWGTFEPIHAGLLEETGFVDSGVSGIARYRLLAVNGLDEPYEMGETAIAPGLRAGQSLALYPSPAREGRTNILFRIPGANGAPPAMDLTIYDIAGRRVRTLETSSYRNGLGTTLWDGRDDSGRAVAGGVYFVRLSANGLRVNKRVVVVR